MQRHELNPSLFVFAHFFCVILLCFPIPFAACANSLSGIRWDSKDNAFSFHITTEAPVQFDAVDKTREEACFILDVRDVTRIYENRTLNLSNSYIEKVIIQSRPWENIVRFRFYPGSGIHWKISPGKNRNHIQVEFHKAAQPKIASNPRPVSQSAIDSPSAPKSHGNLQQGSSSPRSNRKLVIIDPGHGGFNKGARTHAPIKGKHYWEKDLVAQYAQKLKYLIQQSPNLSALLTREKDEYVSLGDRVNFSQKRNGDLFLSIHLNASPNPRSKTARGLEIFYWRETGSDNAAGRYLEKLENDQLLPELPKSQDAELKNVLSSMLKDALEEERAKSARLANVLWEVMSQNPYFKKYHRKPVVKSARFVVLANYAMPSVLVEVGFLSNREEAPYLITDSFQWTTAKLLYNGIQAFFEQEDSDFKAHYIK